jgi:hypothetical protein
MPKFTRENARENALKSAAAKAMRKTAQAIAQAEAAKVSPAADWKAKLCNRHAYALELLTEEWIKHIRDADKARSYAMAIASGWQAWHSASDSPRPGLAKGNKGTRLALPPPGE